MYLVKCVPLPVKPSKENNMDKERAQFFEDARSGKLLIDEQLHKAAIDELIEAHVRITNLEAIAQALADELMAQDDTIDGILVEYAHALDTLENYEQEYAGSYRKPGNMGGVPDYEDWLQTREDARNAGNP